MEVDILEFQVPVENNKTLFVWDIQPSHTEAQIYVSPPGVQVCVSPPGVQVCVSPPGVQVCVSPPGVHRLYDFRDHGIADGITELAD